MSSPNAPVPPQALRTRLPESERAAIVTASGLEQMGVRPTLRSYVRSLWQRRTFITVLATSKAYARNQNNYLGQFWALLNPILNAAVYILIFGFVLRVSRAGVDNSIAFIVIGTFMFRFFETSIHAGAKSIQGNLNLVRSVHFPRASLPISGVLAELTTLLPALGVMVIISWGSGLFRGDAVSYIPISWTWLLLLPTVALLWVFNTGCAFLVARWVAITPDLQNILPFMLRLLMYGSGVIFSLHQFVGDRPWAFLVEYQPVAVYLYLARSSIMDEPLYPPDSTMWLLGAGWALLFLVVGFLVFWRGEERYGRD